MEDIREITKKLAENKTASVRLFGDMTPALREPSAAAGEKSEKIAYEMYRAAEPEKYEKETKEKNLRYDITIISPESFNAELSKTFGHYHKNRFTEITEAADGTAWYLLQKKGSSEKIIEEVYLAEVKEGEKIIYPVGFGHITINPNEKKLSTSNWVSVKAESDYSDYEKLHGGCYYVLRENGEIIFEKNPNYEKVPEIVKLRPKEIPEMGIVFDKPLVSYIENPQTLDFLSNIEKYKDILTIEKCFEKI
ncbi:MAG: glucose-6-phosphate isomerase family protein [Candidatus Pacebacteria bacterium]|nr:glucose-6-phosphate isomerase family protein [Candidatus Paceibacterota bacterium]